jgi:hypothetical protein
MLLSGQKTVMYGDDFPEKDSAGNPLHMLVLLFGYQGLDNHICKEERVSEINQIRS